MEGSVAVAAGHLILTRRPAVPAGAVAALPTLMLLRAGRPPHGVLRKRPIRTPKEAEHRSIPVPKLRTRTRRKVGERRVGVHLLGHRIPILLLVLLLALLLLLLRRIRVPLDQDGAARRPLGEGQRQSRHPLGTTARPRRVTVAGPVLDHLRREDGASQAG
jgi:hypothetical protein